MLIKILEYSIYSKIYFFNDFKRWEMKENRNLAEYSDNQKEKYGHLALVFYLIFWQYCTLLIVNKGINIIDWQ